MALIAVVSPGGASGATTTAVALSLSWPAGVLLAECDITGGSVMAGLFGGHAPTDRGLLQVAASTLDSAAHANAVLWDQTVAMDERGSRPLLPGPADPFQARAISSEAWQHLASLLALQSCDVIADVGQVLADPAFPGPLLDAADLIVMVMRPMLRQVAAAAPRLGKIREALGEGVPVGLCLIGRGPYPAGEVRSALGPFRCTVLLPDDPRTARRLSDGTGRPDPRGGDLMVQARPAARTLRDAATSASRAGVQGRST